MSWAIDKVADDNDERVSRLRTAVSNAAKTVLLFCANPDKGEGRKNDTYPATLSTRVFCIGAANEDGQRWKKISSDDESCSFYLPGVELGIKVAKTANLSKKDVGAPPEDWAKHDGSSLACALATGLAAMVRTQLPFRTPSLVHNLN
jgi:hypothetical protein